MAIEKKVEKEKKGKSGILTYIIVAVLAVALAFGGAFGGYMLGAKAAAKASATKATEVVQVKNTAVSSKTLVLDDFLVNLLDKHVMKIKIVIGYESETIGKELEANKPIIRDSINSVLRSKSSDALSVQTGIDSLKQEILDKINPLLTAGKADNVYFNDLIIQ